MASEKYHATTILGIRREDAVALGGDGQVTIGSTAVKHKACKVRKIGGGKVLAGFAGSVADAFTLLEMFERLLKDQNGHVLRAATELARRWRTDKILRRLESLLAVASSEHMLLISGGGEVIEPDDGVIGIGSGGDYAAAAGKALVAHTDLSPPEIVSAALNIAADICVYTNHHITVEEL